MSTDFNFNKKLDGKGHMVAYAKVMEQFDLSDIAIKEFAEALDQGNLDNIKKIFGDLSRQQKSGLLKLYIDYNDVKNTTGLDRRGFVLDLAKKYEPVSEYLTMLEKEISPHINSHRFGRSSSAGLFANPNKQPVNSIKKTTKISGTKSLMNFSFATSTIEKKVQSQREVKLDKPAAEIRSGKGR